MCRGAMWGGRVWGLAPVPKISWAKVMVYYIIYALKFFLYLLFALIPRLSDWVPALGTHPGTRGVGTLTLPGAVCSPHRPPGILCLSALGVPFAGGELAPRGTCPSLVLYLVKRNKPP